MLRKKNSCANECLAYKHDGAQVEWLFAHVHLVDGLVEQQHALREQPHGVDARVEAEDVAVGRGRPGRQVVHCALGDGEDHGAVALVEQQQRRAHAANTHSNRAVRPSKGRHPREYTNSGVYT